MATDETAHSGRRRYAETITETLREMLAEEAARPATHLDRWSIDDLNRVMQAVTGLARAVSVAEARARGEEF